ncbi:putative reverse transcriptase domain-containing protein [Tanacetum coccineum]|uniref:Reverse transcriptase domain-containing protein n=1 Tax=Tanacetum coccineum TaxID=301880 RepID=A0ABQ4X2J9_9ASTR
MRRPIRNETHSKPTENHASLNRSSCSARWANRSMSPAIPFDHLTQASMELKDFRSTSDRRSTGAGGMAALVIQLILNDSTILSYRTPEVALFSEYKLFNSSSCLKTLGGNPLEFNSLSECHPVVFSLESISLSENLLADSEVVCLVNELLSSSAFHVKLLLVDEPEGSEKIVLIGSGADLCFNSYYSTVIPFGIMPVELLFVFSNMVWGCEAYVENMTQLINSTKICMEIFLIEISYLKEFQWDEIMFYEDEFHMDTLLSDNNSDIPVEDDEVGDLGEPANYKTAMVEPVEVDMDGKVHTYKARLVAKGCTQTYGIDYEETFSPVADIRAIRILIAIAAYYDYEIWQMDVKTAFLNGRLDEDIYMEQPEGYVDPNYPNGVCKLQRAISSTNRRTKRENHSNSRRYASCLYGSLRVGDKVDAQEFRLGTGYSELPEEPSRVHTTFHVSNLKECHADEPLSVSLDGLHFDDKLQFVEEPIEITDREVKRLKQSCIPLVKVLWNSKRGPEFTWECEDQFRKKYPHLFSKTGPSSSAAS